MTAPHTDPSPPLLTDPRRKKMLFRAWHRGTREADLLVGRFAEHYLRQCTDADLDLFEQLLAQPDPDIFDWISGKEPIPANSHYHAVLYSMAEFYQARS